MYGTDQFNVKTHQGNAISNKLRWVGQTVDPMNHINKLKHVQCLNVEPDMNNRAEQLITKVAGRD